MSWRVPGYVAEELVGFGATGEVWRGRDTASGELVALKRLRTVDPEQTARLRREAAVLGSLDHPHLLRLREAVRSGEEWVLVLDYAAGGSLAGLLRARGRLRPGELVTALAPLAAALAYAHGEGLVHGDVTPSNVLLTSDGRPWLADLGIARIAGEGGGVQATPEYADPVVARGSLPGPPSDVFAVGAIAFHALTGAPPWSAPTAEEALFLASTAELPALHQVVPGVPAPMLAVLERVLSPDPAARGSAAELALDLRHSCRPEPIELPGPVATTVPEAAWPAALTHAVRVQRPGASAGGSHRADRRRGRAVWRLLRSPGLRAAALAVLSIAVAVRLRVAWAGSDADGVAAQRPDPVASTGSAGSGSAGDSGSAGASSGAGTTAPQDSAAGLGGSWSQILSTLDDRRSAAFAVADPALLQRVYTAGSPALRSDVTQVSSLRKQGLTAHGVRHTVRSVRVEQDGSRRVVLAVQEALQGYELRSGGVARQQPAAPLRRYRITLIRTGAQWRIEQLQLLGMG